MKVNSEIGKLRKVILHYPSLSLDRLTPENCREFLFDDVLWTQKAQEEHIVFQNKLMEQGIEVYLLDDLLLEAIEDPIAREWLAQKAVDRIYHGTSFDNDLLSYLRTLDTKTFIGRMLGGLTWKEMDINPAGLTSHQFEPTDFVLPPLPNHLFARDASCWIGQGVSINQMFYPARVGETLNYATIYKFHPLFKDNSFETWYDGSEAIHQLPSLEGGDVLVLNKTCIAIGISSRTTPQAIELLAKQLLAKSDIKTILAIAIPKERSSMHLDTVMTMANHDTFCIASSDIKLPTWRIRLNHEKNELVVEAEKNIFDAIARELGEKKLQLISIGGDAFAEQREQWTDASNLLAVAPGKIIAYDRNTETNDKLRKAGIDVIEIEGAELGRGGGRPRCMSGLIYRD